MKKKHVFIVISMLIAMVVAMCACNQAKDFAGYSESMNNSMGSVKNLTSVLSVYDGEVLVYEYQRNMMIDGDNATIETTEKKLNTNFKLDSSTSTENKSNVDKSKLLPLSLTESSAQNLKLRSDGFSCEIPEEDLASVLKLGSYEIAQTASLDCVFSGDKLSSINCAFKLTDGKDVKLTYTYNY